MGLQILLQSFDGSCAAKSEDLRVFIAPMLNSAHSRVVTQDGGADVYGIDREPIDSLMLDHVSGEAIFEVIFRFAELAGWAVIPVGCPICVMDNVQRELVPAELAAGAGVVAISSGIDLLAAIRSA